jgi:hypothetical protein
MIQQKIDFDKKQSLKDDRKRKREAVQAEAALVTPERRIREEISSVVDLTMDLDETGTAPPKKRNWTATPANHHLIADYAIVYGKESAINTFKAELGDRSHNASDQALTNWIRRRHGADHAIPDVTPVRAGPPPCYGWDTDDRVYEKIKHCMDLGLPIDDDSTHRIIRAQLILDGKEHLLKMNGGTNTFGHGFCQRFFKRRGLVTRIVTTKMRDEVPANYLQKRENYVRIAAALIARFHILPGAVIGCDETAVLFCPRATRTKAKIGAKRVRVIGVGSEKAQLTATLFVTGEGQVLKHQLIFGGKTPLVHPKHPQPLECVWSQTASHWQTPTTFIQAVTEIVLPYQQAFIRENNLPADQAFILKVDMHHSHKDAAVRTFLRNNNIYPLYVPGGCTDILQECDTVVNKTFKAAIKASFRDLLHEQYDEHLAEGGDPVTWRPKLTMGALKPHMCGFVAMGIAALRKPTMTAAIARAFEEDGLFNEIRSEERQAAARALLLVDPTVVDRLLPGELDGAQPAVAGQGDVVNANVELFEDDVLDGMDPDVLDNIFAELELNL